jgi:hypothetical protein
MPSMRTTPIAVAPPLTSSPVKAHYVDRARLLIRPAPLPSGRDISSPFCPLAHYS